MSRKGYCNNFIPIFRNEGSNMMIPMGVSGGTMKQNHRLR
eukprot:CAMPEP_0204834040 /NCGR_PEP_ID=MMETSP1346-20131115/18521_1 /ASSEMBLY_ACC=CAM_ASM_000771 /TAXON_ID=215587 /ORGANISM="Aplanochytrium stocchinoi, Strain GSBS06" /LENGTH=39 /DNA_ID= /DNA_START= /DNA_END= /DNA_ORIENTATION=